MTLLLRSAMLFKVQQMMFRNSRKTKQNKNSVLYMQVIVSRHCIDGGSRRVPKQQTLWKSTIRYISYCPGRTAQ